MSKSYFNSALSIFLFLVGCASARVVTENDTESLVDHFCNELKSNRDLGPDAQNFFLGNLAYSSSNPNGHLNYKHDLLADLSFKPSEEYRKLIKTSAKGSNGDTLLLCAIKNKMKYAFERLASDASASDLKVLDRDGRDVIFYAKTNADRFYIDQISNRLPKETVKKETYCNGDKPLVRMSGAIEAHRDSDLSNMALDKAQVKIQDFRNKSRKLVKGIFENKVLSIFGQDSERNYFQGIKFTSNGKEITPDPDAINGLGEFSRLIPHFTFMISKKDQEKIFKSESLEDDMPAHQCSDSANYDRSDNVNGYVGLDGNCKFLPSKAISDQRRTWLYVVRKFTALKEAPGKDGKSISYEVSFDLTPFCAFGISVDDLKAR